MLTRESVQRVPNTGDVVVAFSESGQPLRNVLLRQGSKNALDAQLLAALDNAESAAAIARKSAERAFAETCEKIDSDLATARESFAAAAEDLARTQAAEDDAPPATDDDAPVAE